MTLRLAATGIGDYLAALSSAAATPGGGTVAGLTGAQAAALLCMVCHLSRGRRFASWAVEIGEIDAACVRLRDELVTLADDDARSFEQVMAARRTDPRAEDRGVVIAAALQGSIQVSLDMIERLAALVPHAVRLAEIGNRNLITDVGIAARLIDAAAESARLNVLVNAAASEATDFADPARRAVSAALRTIANGCRSCREAVERTLPQR